MQNMPPLTCGVLLLAIDVFFLCHTVVADQCSGGSNIFTEIPENSPHGTLVSHLSVFGDPESNTVQLTLSGMDASWFYLDGKTVRLNASEEKVLDKEVLETPVLMVSFTCTEDGFSPVEYRIIVQVMNENDNKPRFHEDSIMTQNISELAAVHSVVFSTQAEDADGDTLMYVIDSTSADARYFRIDLPNSGKIVLARTLDFETKRHLEFVVHAVEMNTKERYNSSARIRVNVLDGDDQYPQFLPCNVLSHDGTSVCVSPIYTTNITEGEMKTEPLQFLPGAIHAEDGDSDLRTPVVYSILAGTDHGYFHMDNLTGAITMLRPVESRVSTPVYSLSIMAFQVNDAKKYAVAEVRVRVLAANRQSPHFVQSQYQAFVHEDENMASLVVTYSGRVLFLNAMDMDFADGFNPMVRYSLKRQSNHTRLFQVTPGGLLIARSDHLRAFERYALQIIARDEESGETTNTTVKVEVLRFGEEVPLDPADAEHQGRLDAGILAGSLGALLLVTAIVLFLILRAMKKRQRHQQNMERAALAMEKHPNVSLKWFQPVNAGKALPNPGNIYFQNEGYSDLGDELPKTYEGQTVNYKQASTRSERDVATRDTVVANSVGKFNNQGGQAKTNPAPKEQEEGIKAALLNGKTLEQLGSIPPCPEETVLSKDSQVGEVLVEAQPLVEALVEVQVVGEEDKEVLPPETSEGNEEEQVESISGELEEASLQPQLLKEEEDAWFSQEGKMEANGDTSPMGSVAEGSPTDSNCLDSEGGKEHTNVTEEVNGSVTASPVTSDIDTTVDPEINDTANVTDTVNLEVNDSLPRKDPVTPLPTLKELPKQLSEEEDEDEEDGELTPKAMSPTYQDPLASLPVSDVRMPVTLLQLLEDSIEC
ncbi:protocadherin-15-like isoform X1 [Anolis sagrei]|uniref:protocadherin-15-like isoform X1 n=1 Tax=Anolis sagrei TaxID=38937 RepID=UPI0035205593